MALDANTVGLTPRPTTEVTETECTHRLQGTWSTVHENGTRQPSLLAAGSCASRARHFPGIVGSARSCLLGTGAWSKLQCQGVSTGAGQIKMAQCQAMMHGLRTSLSSHRHHQSLPLQNRFFFFCFFFSLLPLFVLSLLLQPMPTSSLKCIGPDLAGFGCGSLKKTCWNPAPRATSATLPWTGTWTAILDKVISAFPHSLALM